MTGMTPDTALLVMWLTFTVMSVLGVSGVLVWAVRSRQFAGQDRARRLPLMSGIPADDGESGKGRRGPADGGNHVPA